MVIPTNAFIHGRINDLDIITAGWRYMQNTMSQEDRMGFEKMINMPGFSVEKFEETYLLRKINPFAKRSGIQEEVFIHSACPCGKEEKLCGLIGMEEKLAQFVAKWDEFLEQYTSQLSLDEASHCSILQKAEELRKETEAQLKVKEKGNSSMETIPSQRNRSNEFDRKVESSNVKLTKNDANGREKHACDTTIVVDGISERLISPVQKETIATDFVNDVSKCPKANFVAVEKVASLLDCIPTEAVGKIENEIESAIGENETSILSSPVDHISSTQADNSRSSGTPDSGMISDISDNHKPLGSQVPTITKEKIDPEKMTGRDGRRYRHRIKKEAEQSLTEKQSEFAERNQETMVSDLTKKHIQSGPNGTEMSEKTGKEKRRLKDKLRKEKRLQENDSPSVEEAGIEIPNKTSVQNTDSVDFGTNTCLLKSEVQISEFVENLVGDAVLANFNAPETPGSESPATEISPSSTNQMSTVQETALRDDIVVEDGIVLDESLLVGQQENNQVQKMSKGQKKRAKKRANRGVYVVNGKRNGSHTVELQANEYTIVKVDQQNESEEVENIDETHPREINLDEIIEQRKKEETSQKKKLKNYYFAGNLSKNILDNGKWLAYVLDDKNGAPKVGEVSNEEVAETMKLLNAGKKKWDEKIAQKALENKVDLNPTPASRPNCSEENKLEEPLAAPSTPTSATSPATLPELDADVVRKTFAELEAESCKIPNIPLAVKPVMQEGKSDNNENYFIDLNLFLNNYKEDYRHLPFHTAFARKTASLFFHNEEFAEFCKSYATSKYSPNVISLLTRRYIDTRIVFHYERFKKLADRESRRISKAWTHINESSAYSLMVMLFINSPISNVGFNEIETVLFPKP